MEKIEIFLVPIILFEGENDWLRFGDHKFCAVKAESKLDAVLKLTKHPSLYGNRKEFEYFEFDRKAEIVESSADKYPMASAQGTILDENYLETMANLGEAA